MKKEDLKFTKINEMEAAPGVVEVWFNRPEIHNAFNDEMIQELTDIFKFYHGNKDLRLLVLRAAGPSFCAGADLNWMTKVKSYTEEQNFLDAQKLAGLFHALNNLPMPTMAVVQGNAFGGGVGIMAACDFVLAQELALFALTEVRLGLIPAVISPYVIAKIGESNARAFFLSGSRFNALRAQKMNLVHQLTTLEHIEADYGKLVQTFLEAGPNSTRAAKELVRQVLNHHRQGKDDISLQQYTSRAISKMRVGKEAQEGMNALLEKRMPSWAPKQKSK